LDDDAAVVSGIALPRGRLESPEGANVDNGNGGCARKGKPRDHADVVEA
jgi:hypothetical protein